MSMVLQLFPTHAGKGCYLNGCRQLIIYMIVEKPLIIRLMRKEFVLSLEKGMCVCMLLQHINNLIQNMRLYRMHDTLRPYFVYRSVRGNHPYGWMNFFRNHPCKAVRPSADQIYLNVLFYTFLQCTNIFITYRVVLSQQGSIQIKTYEANFRHRSLSE